MIKKLRFRFVMLAAMCLLIVEVLIIGSINIINVMNINREEDQLLEILSQNQGKFPELFKHDKGQNAPPPDNRGRSEPYDKHISLNEETKYQTRYFTVSYDESGNVERVDTGHIAAVSSEEAVGYAESVAAKSQDKKYIDNYKYTSVKKENGGQIYIFLDCRKDIDTKNSFFLISVVIGVTGFLLVCVMIIFFSKRAVRPFIESYEKQRRFITDAGHEIKTPLAIISANTEVIEMTSEPSEWTKSIKNQIARLDCLIANMMRLSRMEEGSVKHTFSEFDLSAAAKDTAEPFIILAETRGKKLETDIEEDLRFVGDEGAVRQLISILIENAVKYCDDSGVINAKLCKSENGKNIELNIANTCANPPAGDLSKLFDRFYRADKSRSRDEGEQQGGYGIGLSIAKAVCESHRGKILVNYENGEISFTAIFKI